MNKRWTLGPMMAYMLFLLGVSIFLLTVLPGFWLILNVVEIVFVLFLLRYLVRLYRSL